MLSSSQTELICRSHGHRKTSNAAKRRGLLRQPVLWPGRQPPVASLGPVSPRLGWRNTRAKCPIQFRMHDVTCGVAGLVGKSCRESPAPGNEWLTWKGTPTAIFFLLGCRLASLHEAGTVTCYSTYLALGPWPRSGGIEPNQPMSLIQRSFRVAFAQEEQTVRSVQNTLWKRTLLPTYCACQGDTTTYCYFTPYGSILQVIVRQVNGALLRPTLGQ